MTINVTGPTVGLNSPTGILDPASGALVQPQYLNSDNGQYITYSASSSEALTLAFNGCTPSACMTSLTEGVTSPLQYGWDWSTGGGVTAVTVTAVDQAGNTSTTNLPSGATGNIVFTLFSPSTAGTLSLACTSACTTLGDQEDDDIPGDNPSGPVTPCSGCSQVYFSGYSDPSVRGDPLPTSPNPWATNLWMLYSHPFFQIISPYENTRVVETHLAVSADGGQNWVAWCDSTINDSCDNQPTSVPIWPSETFCTTPPGSQPCTAPCYMAPQHSNCYSSHEVSNFWPYPNYPSPGTETWYAAHLMYFLYPTEAISSGVPDGCLVISLADSPEDLGWAAGSGPTQCGSPDNQIQFPSGNYPLYFTTLGQQAAPHIPDGETCSTWGEPAIMVASGTIFLAVDCFNQYFVGQGYYVFSSTNLQAPAFGTWQYVSGPFGIGTGPGDLPSSAYPGGSNVNSITELDWAVRADQTLVAVVTPASVVSPQDPGPAYQWGCAAVNFSLTSGFGSVIARLMDSASSGAQEELRGPNGCTYEPTSNTGVIIVRNLIDSALQDPTQNETYALIDSGILP